MSPRADSLREDKVYLSIQETGTNAILPGPNSVLKSLEEAPRGQAQEITLAHFRGTCKCWFGASSDSIAPDRAGRLGTSVNREGTNEARQS